jgi:hypothetical protein
MPTLARHPSIKVIGLNGQISLGKQFADRRLVENKSLVLVRLPQSLPTTNFVARTSPLPI